MQQNTLIALSHHGFSCTFPTEWASAVLRTLYGTLRDQGITSTTYGKKAVQPAPLTIRANFHLCTRWNDSTALQATSIKKKALVLSPGYTAAVTMVSFQPLPAANAYLDEPWHWEKETQNGHKTIQPLLKQFKVSPLSYEISWKKIYNNIGTTDPDTKKMLVMTY